MAGVYNSINVYLNDTKISCSNFKKYIDMYKLNIQHSTNTNLEEEANSEDLVDTETSQTSLTSQTTQTSQTSKKNNSKIDPNLKIQNN